jgi:uncharacterized membrane protein
MSAHAHIARAMPVRPGHIFTVVLGGAVLWCGLLVLAPLLAAAGEPWSAPAVGLYSFFHHICHQAEARSLHVGGEPLAVCARCFALYAAFLLGTLLYPLLRSLDTTEQPPRILLLAAGLPMLLDVLAGVTGLHDVTIASRLITGSIAGFILPFFILPAAIGGIGQILHARHQSTIPFTSERTL